MQDTAAVGGFQPQVCTYPVRKWTGSLNYRPNVIPCFCALQSPVMMDTMQPQVCAFIGPWGTGILIIRPMVVRSPESCPDGQCPTLCVCHVIHASPSMDRNTQLYAQYHSTCVHFQNPVAMGGIQPQVCGSTRSLNGQEQPNNMSCLCAFQSPVMINPVQPQVCV